MSLGRFRTALILLLLCPVQAALGFVLLNFRTQADVMLSPGWFSWANSRTGNLYCPGGEGAAFTLSYKVDPGFMANQFPAVQASAELAAISAFKTWEDATGGFLTFTESPWGTVTNCDTITNVAGCPLPCNVTRVAFEGPPAAEFSACTGGPPLWCAPVCWPSIPCPIFPGWGANIEVFSRPTGFALCSNGFRYEMTSNVLAFTCVHRATGGKIQSIDIYLNDCYRWHGSDNATSARSGVVPPLATCHGGCLMTDGGTLAHGPGGCPGGAQTFDIETVVLHELGHALGLDHPNEACAFNAAQLNPWTYAFQPCGQFDPAAVMAGVYAGVKRDLTDDDIGGISFLYRPVLDGDLDVDGAITIFDAIRAIDLAGNPALASPYDVNILDFRQRNGRVDADEAMQVVQWVIDPDSARPSSDADLIKEYVASGTEPPTSVTVDSTSSPEDIGLSSTYQLTVTISNPDAVRFIAWDIDVVYDPAVFSNPVVSNGTFLAGGAWVSTGPDDGNIRFSKFGIGTFDQATSGTLGVITFDVDLTAAAATPPTVMFQYTDVQLVADTPIIHNYGSQMNLSETLNLMQPEVMSYHFDADFNGVIDIEDLYRFFVMPIDVNKNMNITDFDRRSLQDATRVDEVEDVLTGR